MYSSKQNWIPCSSMIFCKTGFCVAQCDLLQHWIEKIKAKLESMQLKTASFGLRITPVNCILGLGVACGTLQVKISMFLRRNPLLPEPTQTAISSVFLLQIMIEKGIAIWSSEWYEEKVCFLDKVHCSLNDSNRNLTYPCTIYCKLKMNEGSTDGWGGDIQSQHSHIVVTKWFCEEEMCITGKARCSRV